MLAQNNKKIFESVFGIENISPEELKIKQQLFDTAWRVIPLTYYKAGGILLFKKAEQPIFQDSLILVINHSGTEKRESEDLAMEMDVDFLDNRMEIVGKSEIKSYNIMQHKCMNPDCPSCKNAEAYSQPFSVEINTSAGTVYLYAGNFTEAYGIIATIDGWRMA